MGFLFDLFSSTRLNRSLSCIILALLIVNANPASNGDENKLKPPITATSRHLVEWKEVPMGTLLFKDKPDRIGHTGSHCNWKGDKATTKMGDEANSAFDNQQYCSLRPEYLLEVEKIEDDVELGTKHYTRLLKFKKDVIDPDDDIIVINEEYNVKRIPVMATGEGYVTILDPGFIAEDAAGLKLKGKMHHRFLQHPAGGEITEGYWKNYEKYSKMMLSETFKSETNGDDLYIKKPVTRSDQEVSVHKHVSPLFALGDLHKDDHGVSGEKVPCGPICTAGKHILVENIGHRTFEANLFVSTKCEWMEVCFSVDEVKETVDDQEVTKYYCRAPPATKIADQTVYTAFTPMRQNRLQVVFRHGIIKMPFQKQPFVHDFQAIRSHQDAFRLSIMRNQENVLVLTTESRERMVNIRGTTFSSSMLFSFSDSKCIHHENSFGGLFSGASKDQYQIKQKGEKLTTSEVKYLKEADVTKMTPRALLPNLKEYEPPSEDKLLPAAAYKDANITNVYSNTGEHSALSLSQAVSGEAGWQTWMIFFGFLCGSFTGTVIVGVLLFVLRRSIYDEWYRGMFKRYHCDPSSQTPGPSAEFAETSNGGSQMSQMSTVQSAMSTVGNSTMGATSGMDTTGGATGADMVTM